MALMFINDRSHTTAIPVDKIYEQFFLLFSYLFVRDF